MTRAGRVEAVSSAAPQPIRCFARLSSTSYVRPGTRRLRLTLSSTPTIGLSIRTRTMGEHITDSALRKLDNDGINYLHHPPDCEYLVVGSGAGGGTVAARLAEAGKRVILLEAGGAPPELIGGDPVQPA